MIPCICGTDHAFKRRAEVVEGRQQMNRRGRGDTRRLRGERQRANLRVSPRPDRKSTRLNSSHGYISYAVFCLKKKRTSLRQIQSTQITYATQGKSPILHV